MISGGLAEGTWPGHKLTAYCMQCAPAAVRHLASSAAGRVPGQFEQHSIATPEQTSSKQLTQLPASLPGLLEQLHSTLLQAAGDRQGDSSAHLDAGNDAADQLLIGRLL